MYLYRYQYCKFSVNKINLQIVYSWYVCFKLFNVSWLCLITIKQFDNYQTASVIAGVLTQPCRSQCPAAMTQIGRHRDAASRRWVSARRHGRCPNSLRWGLALCGRSLYSPDKSVCIQYWSLLIWQTLRLRCGCVAVPVTWFFDINSSYFAKFKNVVRSP